MKAKYLALLAALSVTSAVQAADALTIDVHRDANCGCCKKWISHLEANGFKVVDHVESNMTAVKQRLGVAPRLASCHTAVIDGKFVEGHVPAAQVIELTKRDDLLGIGVKGTECEVLDRQVGLMIKPGVAISYRCGHRFQFLFNCVPCQGFILRRQPGKQLSALARMEVALLQPGDAGEFEQPGGGRRNA